MLSIDIHKELKSFENRVSIVPKDLIEFIDYFNKLKKKINVFIQKGSGFKDEDYIKSPSVILCDTIEEVYNNSKVIIKVNDV